MWPNAILDLGTEYWSIPSVGQFSTLPFDAIGSMIRTLPRSRGNQLGLEGNCPLELEIEARKLARIPETSRS